MRKEEAIAFMNPGICLKCEGRLTIDSKGFLFKDYYLRCTSCGSIWEEHATFLHEIEETGIQTLKREGLSPWPFDVPVLLRKNEIVYLVRENIGLYEGRRYTYRGSSTGMSFRVTGGLWIRSSTGGGTAESEDVMKLLDEGSFVLTNKRIIFIGEKKSVQIPFARACIFKETIFFSQSSIGFFCLFSLSHRILPNAPYTSFFKTCARAQWIFQPSGVFFQSTTYLPMSSPAS